MLSNNEVKYYSSLKQKKFRDSEGKFLIEGFHLVEECLSSRYETELIVFRDNLDQSKKKPVEKSAAGKNVRTVSLAPKLFDRLTDTENSQGIVAVVHTAGDADFRPTGTIIALDRINDPGNLGTIIRTAYWFGIENIITSIGSADIYNSKVLRSSQGAVFHISIKQNSDLEQELGELSASGYKVYLTASGAGTGLEAEKFRNESVFVFGNESAGVSPEILSKGYKQLKIRGFSSCESLNVAVSCGIVLHWLKNSTKIV